MRKFNPIQNGKKGGRRQKVPLLNFSPVTSRNVGISSHNFLTFSLKISVSPKLFSSNQKSGFSGEILVILRL